jgi:hypothetical protein
METKMKKLSYKYSDNRFAATAAYNNCEALLRKVEEIGGHRKMEEYGNVDWVVAAKTMSFFAPIRCWKLQQMIDWAGPSAEAQNKAAFEFIKINCLFENTTAYIVEAFRQKFVIKNKSWNIGFNDWIDSIYVEKEGERYFKYFGHTDNPIFVQ